MPPRLLLLFLLQALSALAISPVIIKGNAFWKDGLRFYIRGVDYQPGGSSATDVSDPLSDKQVCQRDVAKFKDLGINTVRVYSVDPTKNHDDCMKLFEENDIHLILDVNNPKNSINRAAAQCSYNSFYLKNVFDVIDAFAKYKNVLGFFAANEVINDEKTTNTAKYVKAVVRDMKKYIKARKYRQIPVGYSAADIESNRKEQIEYFTCGSDEDARVDFWGHNDYSWCGNSDYETSGYKKLMDDFKYLPIPIFFSEFGCNSVTDRPFTEIKTIYSIQMTNVLSGGLVYEYSQESNNYGLVKINDDKSVTELGSYKNLKKQYADNKNPQGSGGFATTNSYPQCPSTSSTWLSDSTLPNTPDGAKEMIEKGAGKIVSTSELGDTSYKCNTKYNLSTGSSTEIKAGVSAAGNSNSNSNSTTTSATSTSSYNSTTQTTTSNSNYTTSIPYLTNGTTAWNTTVLPATTTTGLGYNSTSNNYTSLAAIASTSTPASANTTALSTYAPYGTDSSILSTFGKTSSPSTLTQSLAGEKQATAAEASTKESSSTTHSISASTGGVGKNMVIPGVVSLVYGIICLL